MTNIVVLGAAGKAGRLIVAEAAQRGHQVTAVVRSERADLGFVADVDVVLGDATAHHTLAEHFADAGAVVVAVGGAGRELYLQTAQAVVETISAQSDPRPYIVHMGGGASLQTPDGIPFVELPGFPAEFLDPAIGQGVALEYYRATPSDVAWTYFSPPPIHFVAGDRTGVYRTGADQPVVAADGEARLTYADAAVVLIDEIETRAHARHRFTAGY